MGGTSGRIRLAAGGANRAIFLAPTALDWDVQTDVSPRQGTDGRRQRVDLSRAAPFEQQHERVSPRGALREDGTTYLSANRVVSGTEVQIGSAVAVPSVNFLTGFTLRGQVTGTQPDDDQHQGLGGAEPATWQYTATDSAGPQVAGAAGLRTYSSSSHSNAPLTFLFDNYSAIRRSAAPRRLRLRPTAPPPPGAMSRSWAPETSRPRATATRRPRPCSTGSPGLCSRSAMSSIRTARSADFNAYYAPTWGRHKSRTIPVIGNHEYQTGNPAGYYAYFGAAAGDPTKGYYSQNLGAWHVIVLNSNCTIISCAAGSAQEQWLRADLAANPSLCTVAMWHHPRFSSGATHGNNPIVAAFWNALYDFNADLVLNGHDHDYERFARQNPARCRRPRARHPGVRRGHRRRGPPRIRHDPGEQPGPCHHERRAEADAEGGRATTSSSCPSPGRRSPTAAAAPATDRGGRPENAIGARLAHCGTGADRFSAGARDGYSLGWSPESPPESPESPVTPAGGSGAVSGTGATTVISTSSVPSLRPTRIVEPGSSGRPSTKSASGSSMSAGSRGAAAGRPSPGRSPSRRAAPSPPR